MSQDEAELSTDEEKQDEDNSEPAGKPEKDLTPAEHAAARQQPEPGDFTVEPPDDDEDDD